MTGLMKPIIVRMIGIMKRLNLIWFIAMVSFGMIGADEKVFADENSTRVKTISEKRAPRYKNCCSIKYSQGT